MVMAERQAPLLACLLAVLCCLVLVSAAGHRKLHARSHARSVIGQANPGHFDQRTDDHDEEEGLPEKTREYARHERDKGRIKQGERSKPSALPNIEDPFGKGPSSCGEKIAESNRKKIPHKDRSDADEVPAAFPETEV